MKVFAIGPIGVVDGLHLHWLPKRVHSEYNVLLTEFKTHVPVVSALRKHNGTRLLWPSQRIEQMHYMQYFNYRRLQRVWCLTCLLSLFGVVCALWTHFIAYAHNARRTTFYTTHSTPANRFGFHFRADRTSELSVSPMPRRTMSSRACGRSPCVRDSSATYRKLVCTLLHLKLEYIFVRNACTKLMHMHMHIMCANVREW